MGGGRFCDEVTEEITKNHLQMIRRFVKLGGQIALGSDAGAWRVPHVEGLRTELSYLKEIVNETHLAKTQRMIQEKFSNKD